MNYCKLLFVTALFLIISGCTNQPGRAPQQTSYTPTTALISARATCNELTPGERAACFMTQDYNNTARDCSGLPAFLCTGVIIRVTDPNINRPFYSWNPSPASQTSGGVSFTFLRKDSSTSKLAFGYTSGLVFYNVFWTPENKDDNINVLCAFSLDAGTDIRDNKGCGQITGYPNSVPCYSQGITTGQQWYTNNYQKANGNRWNYCGFLVNEGDQNTTNQFMAMVDGRNLLPNQGLQEQNELRLATWAQNKTDIPIQAFFYVIGSASGKASAQKDQRDYATFSQSSTGTKEIIPIIKVTLSSTVSQPATFNFDPADQVVTRSTL